ncbi:hypothetical protein GNY06_09965 [Elizabethkingia argentiflava]|uniref:DUF3575 domain-containing protein n=1 Tax=Elizabethkingia argenteiflava TaxID=2681556 RepID=A0A845PV26_9FLAO|nr:hypothetical protein [Elizabethkingia argenteiflava]NAW51684.1 hypothetical protein [Elizabethkingia argenteiflava]
MKNIISLFCFFCLPLSVGLKAQYSLHPMLYAGYTYQNQSFGEVGGRLLFLKNDDILFRIGAVAAMGETHARLAIMPKAQLDVLLNFERGVDLYHSWYFLVGSETTPTYIAPKLGVSVLGLVDITGGYAFNYTGDLLQGKELKGFNFNLTFNFPLVILSKK